jgi:UDP-N-acetylglucosamine 4,6-dehydratase
MTIFDNATILVTGGTGSFGKRFIETLLAKQVPRKVIVFSRDELKQSEMRKELPDSSDSRIRYFIGDVRDRERLRRAFGKVDIVVHSAALKQVPTCEYNPIEAVQTNIIGTQNVIDAAIDQGVKRVLALSSDKAVNPVNLYGATKLCMEKLMVHANSYSGDGGTRFSCSRYGNVVASRGSVVPLFLEQRQTGVLTATDRRMTRFWLTLDQSVIFVLNCIEQMHGGEIFVPKISSMRIMDLAQAIGPDCNIIELGIRPGETLHEALISEDEARNTAEVKGMYVIKPVHPWWNFSNWDNGKPLPEGFRYTSDTNTSWLGADELMAPIDPKSLSASSHRS